VAEPIFGESRGQLPGQSVGDTISNAECPESELCRRRCAKWSNSSVLAWLLHDGRRDELRLHLISRNVIQSKSH